MKDRSSTRSFNGMHVLLLGGLVAMTSLACRTVGGDALAPELRAAEFCVEAHAADRKNFDLQIADSIRQAGLKVMPARPGECPEEIPYRVTYVDHFGWDFRPFLAKLLIEVVDAETGEVLAWGSSQQGSLGAMGTTYRDVIDRAVAALIANSEGSEQ